MRLSEKLRRMAVGKHVGFASLLEAADLLDATTPRPWPPPEGVWRCLGWDRKYKKWRVVTLDMYVWKFEGSWADVYDYCTFWQPTPPEPEESK